MSQPGKIILFTLLMLALLGSYWPAFAGAGGAPEADSAAEYTADGSAGDDADNGTHGSHIAVTGTASDETTYTAQRKPRVTVMQFVDTNSAAQSGGYGASVSAMLVTHLKRQSQLVVVERQDLQHVLGEWERSQKGLAEDALDPEALALLARIDVIIQGSVTLLDNKIEIDAKLLSRHDGRIISAAQRGGPISCLRQVVERVGILLEHDFLRPYYGRLKIVFDDPENTHFHLTPVLMTGALDEEKPPVELSSTVFPGDEQDRVEKWITNPSTYVIKNVLSGWYTLRLERPGYESVESIENDRFEVVSSKDSSWVFYQSGKGKVRVDRAGDAPWRKFLVRVDPLTVDVIDANNLGFQMRKKTGSIQLAIYGETDQELESARVFLRNVDLEINPESPDSPKPNSEPIDALAAAEKKIDQTVARATDSQQSEASEAGEFMGALAASVGRALQADRPQTAAAAKDVSLQADAKDTDPCDFFLEEEISYTDFGQKILRSNQRLEVENFKGGHLSIESYHGEKLPTGTYEVFVWAPNYRLRRSLIRISDGDGGGEPQKVRLTRNTRSVMLLGKSDTEIHFDGAQTRHNETVTLDSKDGIKEISLPADVYDISVGSEPWEQIDIANLDSIDPPSMDTLFSLEPAEINDFQSDPTVYPLPVKNLLWVGGRFEGFMQDPRYFYDPTVGDMLDEILSVSQSQRKLRRMFQDEDDLAELSKQLENIDLLILDEQDTSKIRALPAVAETIRNFVNGGRALMAFVSDRGDYEALFGASLTVSRMGGSRVVKLGPGELETFALDYRIGLGASRPVPRVKSKGISNSSSWRVVSYARGNRNPRVLEHGSIRSGQGYVMVWLDSSRTTARHSGESGSVPKKIFNIVRDLFLAVPKPVASSTFGSSEHGDSAERAKKEAEKKKEKERERARRLRAEWQNREANARLLLAKAELKSHALLWANCLMHRRLGSGDPAKYEEVCQQLP